MSCLLFGCMFYMLALFATLLERAVVLVPSADCSKADRWLRHSADGVHSVASNSSAAQQNGFFTATPHQPGRFPGFQVSTAQQQATPMRLAFGSATRPPTGRQVTPGFSNQHTPPFGSQTLPVFGRHQSTPAQPRSSASAASAGLSAAMTLQQQPNFEVAEHITTKLSSLHSSHQPHHLLHPEPGRALAPRNCCLPSSVMC